MLCMIEYIEDIGGEYISAKYTMRNFERFQYLKCGTMFLKNDKAFQKTGIFFLVESTNI